MPAVEFNVERFRVRYPEFSNVSDELLEEYFIEAGLYLDNTDRSIVRDLKIRERLLWMLTAHIAMLYVGTASGAGGTGGQGLAGRVTNAREGSVSVSVDAGPTTEQSAWFMQTPYGMQFWRATSPYRRAIYVPGYSVTNTRRELWRNRGA